MIEQTAARHHPGFQQAVTLLPLIERSRAVVFVRTKEIAHAVGGVAGQSMNKACSTLGARLQRGQHSATADPSTDQRDLCKVSLF